MTNQLLRAMYSSKSLAQPKNPNRVMGGLRAHGMNSYTVIAEDGSEQAVPSQRYVETLEQKVLEQTTAIKEMQKQIERLNRNTNNLKNQINTVTRNSTYDNSVFNK
jgi:predicted RNase H-like nuclease (RuvC/YqgF family)